MKKISFLASVLVAATLSTAVTSLAADMRHDQFSDLKT